jgi:hypothetical protein
MRQKCLKQGSNWTKYFKVIFIKFSQNLVGMFPRGATEEIFNGWEGDIISCGEEVGKLAYPSWGSWFLKVSYVDLARLYKWKILC